MSVVCPNCKSSAVVPGVIPGADGNTTNGFQPMNTKLASKILFRKVRLTDGELFHGCQACGLIWGRTDPSELSSFVAKHVKDDA